LDALAAKKIQVENKTQEAIKLVYADNDIVYVSIHTKYQNNGKDGTPPKIYKLGSNAWKVLKQNQGKSQTYCFQLNPVVR
jgi:transcription-repair coupling factor (superfamily II helicase)